MRFLLLAVAAVAFVAAVPAALHPLDSVCSNCTIMETSVIERMLHREMMREVPIAKEEGHEAWVHGHRIDGPDV